MVDVRVPPCAHLVDPGDVPDVDEGVGDAEAGGGVGDNALHAGVRLLKKKVTGCGGVEVYLLLWASHEEG